MVWYEHRLVFTVIRTRIIVEITSSYTKLPVINKEPSKLLIQ
jgi:hypothetical protein